MDDLISRQAVLKIIDGWYENNRDIENIEDLIILITYMASIKPQAQEPCEDCISRKAAYEIVDNMLMGERNHKSKALDEIKFLPSVMPAQNVCEDCISRSEAIRIASGYCHWTNIPDELAKLPPVMLAPKIGRWIIKEEYHRTYAECSECGMKNYAGIINYCPNCGAKMEGVEE